MSENCKCIAFPSVRSFLGKSVQSSLKCRLRGRLLQRLKRKREKGFNWCRAASPTVTALHISESSLHNSPWLVVISQAEPGATDKPVRHRWKCQGGSISRLSNERYQLPGNQSRGMQVCMQIIRWIYIYLSLIPKVFIACCHSRGARG